MDATLRVLLIVASAVTVFPVVALMGLVISIGAFANGLILAATGKPSYGLFIAAVSGFAVAGLLAVFDVLWRLVRRRRTDDFPLNRRTANGLALGWAAILVVPFGNFIDSSGDDFILFFVIGAVILGPVSLLATVIYVKDNMRPARPNNSFEPTRIDKVQNAKGVRSDRR